MTNTPAALTIADVVESFCWDEVNRDECPPATFYCMLAYLNRD
jgi:hypothetical protein